MPYIARSFYGYAKFKKKSELIKFLKKRPEWSGYAATACYIARDLYGEATASKFRDVCPTCYDMLKFSPLHFVEVKFIRGTNLPKTGKEKA